MKVKRQMSIMRREEKIVNLESKYACLNIKARPFSSVDFIFHLNFEVLEVDLIVYILPFGRYQIYLFEIRWKFI